MRKRIPIDPTNMLMSNEAFFQLVFMNRSSSKIPEDKFTGELRSFLQDLYPEFDANRLIRAHHESIESLEQIYLDLEAIYRKRDRYDLHWALHESSLIHTRLTEEMERTIDEFLTSTMRGRKPAEIDIIEQELRDIDRKRSWAILHNEEYFSTLSFFVNFVDIVISVFLIVIISEIAHIGGNFFDSVLLGIVFIATIALLKVSLDRFYIIPTVKYRGWKRYLSAITISKKTMIKLRGITMVLSASVENYDDPGTIIALIERGIRKI